MEDVFLFFCETTVTSWIGYQCYFSFEYPILLMGAKITNMRVFTLFLFEHDKFFS